MPRKAIKKRVTGNARPKKSKQKNGKSAPSLTNNASPDNRGRSGGVPLPRPKRNGVKPHHVAKQCSITDPFCPLAKGSKWPDGTSGNTFAEQFRGHVPLVTTASGWGAVLFASAAPYGYNKSSTEGVGVGQITSTGNWNIDTALSPYQTSSLLSTAGLEYRIVSFGVVARVNASATTASGTMSMGTLSAVPSGGYQLGGTLYPEQRVKSVQPGLEMAWIAKPRGPGARTFISLSTNTSNPTMSNDWTNLIVEVYGGPASTPVMDIEWYMNVEFTVNAGQALARVAPPNPPAIPILTTGTSKVHSSLGSILDGGVKAVEDTVISHAKNALNSFLDDPLEAVGALFGF